MPWFEKSEGSKNRDLTVVGNRGEELNNSVWHSTVAKGDKQGQQRTERFLMAHNLVPRDNSFMRKTEKMRKRFAICAVFRYEFIVVTYCCVRHHIGIKFYLSV